MGAARRELARALAAVQYFTRLRVPAWVGHSQELLDAAARYFPLVGVLVGSVAAAVLLAASTVLPATVATVLSTAAAAWLTGAFHEDGLADCVDGLGGSQDRSRALEIMKDSRIGSFGALALLLVVATKIAALAELGPRAAPALVAGHAFSRLCAVLVMWRLPYVREDAGSKSKPLVHRLSGATLAVALPSGAGAAMLAGRPATVAVICALLLTLGAAGALQRRLGGYTGDALGAVQQLSEVAFYLGLLSRWRP